jgi:hypothetical protein
MIKEELCAAVDPTGVSQVVTAASLVVRVADHASSDDEDDK